MLAAQTFKDISGRPCPARLDVFEPASDSFNDAQTVQKIQQSLIPLGILHHELRFPINGKHHGMARSSHLLEKPPGMTLEITEGMNVFADIDHGKPPAPNL